MQRLLVIFIICLFWNFSFAETENEKSIGLLLGDPVALSLRIPVKEKTFMDFRTGIWTWHFWHDQNYNTPYLSVDYAWLFSNFYAGIGAAFFFADNPKDENDYPMCAAIRFPLGRKIYTKESFIASKRIFKEEDPLGRAGLFFLFLDVDLRKT